MSDYSRLSDAVLNEISAQEEWSVARTMARREMERRTFRRNIREWRFQEGVSDLSTAIGALPPVLMDSKDQQ